MSVRRVPDIVIIGQELWDGPARRNRLLIEALARRSPGSRLLFVELPARVRTLSGYRPRAPRQVSANIWVFRTVRPVPEIFGARISNVIEAAQIRWAAQRLGLADELIWTQDPRAAEVIDRLGPRPVIFDLTDDWPAFERDPETRSRVRARVLRLTRTAAVVLACSPALERRARADGASPLLLPNATEPIAPDGPVAAALGALPRPIIGYLGTLHASRLDIELIRAGARLKPDWSFVFVGPNGLDERDFARLDEPANVHYLGEVPHRDVDRILRGFDVGLVPNVDSEFTRSLDPLKTYQYLAAGLPVVSTPVGVPDAFAVHIRVVADPAELVAAVSSELAVDDAERAAARRAAVAGETWDARARAVEAALPRRPSPERSDELTVVIVSFNTRELLRRCLEALLAEPGPALVPIVVDNGSSDGTLEMLREYPAVELTSLDHNIGFGPANNLALKRARGRHILLLNSDAFIQEGAIAELLAAAERHPRAGALGPRLLNADGSLQRSAWPFPSPGRLLLEAVGLHRLLRRTPFYEDLGTWDHSAERPVDFLTGACLLLRAEALDQVGGFDERFSFYGEEADLQKRLRDHGWEAVLAPAAVVTHLGGASSPDELGRLRSFYRGQRLFLHKHSGAWGANVGALALLVNALLRRRRMQAQVALELIKDSD